MIELGDDLHRGATLQVNYVGSDCSTVDVELITEGGGYFIGRIDVKGALDPSELLSIGQDVAKLCDWLGERFEEND